MNRTPCDSAIIHAGELVVGLAPGSPPIGPGVTLERYPDGAVAWLDGEIVDAGPTDEVLSEWEPAEARTGYDPGKRYAALADEFGSPVARRVEAAATAQQKKQLAALTSQQITSTELAGEKVESVLSQAPGNGEAIGGIKVNTANGWFAARPSGTESIYKIYAESFTNAAHLQRILTDAQVIVDAVLSKESR